MNWLHTGLVLGAAFLGTFLEASWDLPRRWLGAQVTLLPPLVVYAAVSADLPTLSLLAVLGGLWTDALSANPLGVSVLPLFGIGLALERWRDLLLRELAYAQVVMGLLASALAPMLTWLLLLSVGEHPLIGWGSLWQLLAVSAVGGAVTPACFELLQWLQGWLAYQPVAAPHFRPDRELKRGRS